MSCCTSCQLDGIQWRNTERAVIDWIQRELRDGRAFYINDDLNSDTLSLSDFQGMGIAWVALLKTVGSFASKAGSFVATGAKMAGSAAGASGGSGILASLGNITGSAFNILGTLRGTQGQQQVGGSITPSLAQSMAPAIAADVSAPANNQLLLWGGVALLAVMLISRK